MSTKAERKQERLRELERDEARIAREAAALMRALVDLEGQIGDADEDPPGLTEQLEQLQGMYRELVQDPERATAIAEHLLALDLEVERVVAQCKLRVDRAKRKSARAWHVLWPALLAWARQQEPAPGTKGTVRLVDTTAKLVRGEREERVEFADKEAVLAWMREQVGLATAREQGMVRVQLVPSRSGVLAWFKEHGGELPPGCEYEPASERFSLRRQ